MSEIIKSIARTGSWVPTYTGFSAPPTSVTADYILIGSLCHIYVDSTAGTGNATAITITLPFPAANTSVQSSLSLMIANNGIQAAPGLIRTRVNSNIADLYPTGVAGNWAATGATNARISFTYKIA